MPVELTVEIWPTCIVVPPGYRMGLRISGRDYEYDGTDAGIEDAPYAMKGVGPFTHTDPVDRPPDVFGGTTTLHFGAGRAPRLVLPVIPARRPARPVPLLPTPAARLSISQWPCPIPASRTLRWPAPRASLAPRCRSQGAAGGEADSVALLAAAGLVCRHHLRDGHPVAGP